MPNPEDITDPTTAINIALALMAKAFKLNYSTPTNNNQWISSNLRNRQIAQPSMNMGQDRQLQMVRGNGENQFRQYAGQNVGNLNGYNDVQNVKNHVIQHAVQNPRIQNVVQGNANQNRNGNLVAARAEGNANGHNADLDEIEEVNTSCILMANLQQASTSVTSNLIPTPQESKVVKNDKVIALGMFRINPFKTSSEEKHVSNNVRASTRTKPITVSHPLVITKKDVVSDQKDNTRGTSANTKFAKQSIMENPPMLGETHALSKLVTSNLIPTLQESKVVKNDKVIAPAMFRINPFKTSREEKHVPNTVRVSARTKPITVSQPPVFTKKDVNSDSNGLSSTGIDNTKTRRPQPRSNTKNYRVPYASRNITDPTTAMNMALALMAKAFKLNYSTLTNNNQRISSNPMNRQIVQSGMNMGQDRQMQMIGGNGGNQVAQNPRIQNICNHNGLIGVQGNGIQNQIGNGDLVIMLGTTARPRRRDAAYLQTQLLIAQKEEAGIQLQAEEYDLMAAAADLDKIEKVNTNCILMANLQQASSSGTQTDSTLVYDSDGSAKVHEYENCYNNEIFNMFTQEEQYTELLEPILESHQVPQNDNEVISEVTGVEQGGETVEQHSVNFEETRALYESLYQN
nr:hypothetical protein [Tanacetum cinerariifolium]